MRPLIALLGALLLALAPPAPAAAQTTNTLTLRGAPSSRAPQLAATGTDVNIDIDLVPKGGGVVTVNGTTLGPSTGATLPASCLTGHLFSLVTTAQTGVQRCVTPNVWAPLGWQTTVRDLSTGELATLASVPVAIVPAQGAGTVIVPVAASTLQYKAGSVAFTQDAAVNFVGFSAIAVMGFAGLTSELTSVPGVLLAPVAVALLQGAALQLTASVDPGNPGAADGVGRVTAVWYRLDLR